jgi:hypothetical protein
MILVLISDTIVLCVAVSELGQTPAITGRQSLLMLEQNHHVTMSFSYNRYWRFDTHFV